MSYILKGLNDEYCEDTLEIFRSVNRMGEEELMKVCVEYVKYFWLDYEPDREGFQVLDFENCGDKYKLVFNAALGEDGEYGYENVELFFAYDEVPDNVGWLVKLEKEN